MIHYTCMHCGKVANLPDEKRETIFTCPACQFSNWVSGMAIAEPEQPSLRLRQEASPPARAAGGQSQAPHPALQRPAPRQVASQHPAARRPMGDTGQPRTSQPQPHPPSKGPPPPPLPPQGQVQSPPQAAKPGTPPAKPLSGIERNLEMLQRDSARATPPPYHPHPVHTPNQKAEVCPQAIGAFVLGLFSLLSLLGPVPFTVILCLVTLGLAVAAKTKITAEPDRYSGAGLASFAFFLGVLGMIFAMAKGCGR